MGLEKKKVIIIGGSSGIGLAVAKAAKAAGGEITIASRSEENLIRAKGDIGGDVAAFSLDATRENKVKDFFDQFEALDHMVITASIHPYSIGGVGPFLDLDSSGGRGFFESKFWSQYYAAKYSAPKINEGGSITFTSGAMCQRPLPGHANTVAVNGAINTLGYALAVEFGPKIRVNVISPGLVITPVYDAFPEEKRKEWMRKIIEAGPLKRAASPEEVAETYLYVMQNGFTTGSVIEVDGGYKLSRLA